MGQLKLERLQPGEVVALDTVTLIYFLERHPLYYPQTHQLFQRIEDHRLAAVMASLVFTELLVPAYRAGEAGRAETLLHTLNNFPHLKILPLTPTIAVEAARLRARYNLRTPDAIHAATALAGGAKGLVTNDQGLSRLEPELKIWSLAETRIAT